MKRFALLAAAAVVLSGCAAQTPPPVSDKVAAYYSNPPTPTIDAAPDPAVMLKRIKASIAGTQPLTISVLGDSTGNERGEWVDLWARHLAKYGTVTVHFWDPKGEYYHPKTETYPGPERPIVIWDGAMPGANAQYGMDNLDELQPEKPSFVIMNYGHNQGKDGASALVWQLSASIEDKWGKLIDEAVTLQNPSMNARANFSARSVADLQGYALRFGRPVIDVHTAFQKAGNLPSLLQDDVHPNPAGSRLWADTVISKLG